MGSNPPSLRFAYPDGIQRYSPGENVSLIVTVHRGSDPLKKGTICTNGNAQFLPLSLPIDPSDNPEAKEFDVKASLYGRQGCYIRKLDYALEFAYKADDEANTQLAKGDFCMPANMWTKDFLSTAVSPQHKVMYKNELLDKKTFNIHFFGKMGVGKSSLINKLVGSLHLGEVDRTPQALCASGGAAQCTTEIQRVQLPRGFSFVFYDTIGKDTEHYPPGMLRSCLDGTLRKGTTMERMVQIFHSLTQQHREVLAQTSSHHCADIAILVLNAEQVMNDSPETTAELTEMYNEAKEFRPLVVINKIELLPTPDPHLTNKTADRFGISVDRVFENTNHDSTDPKEIFRRNLMGLDILRKALESCSAASHQEMRKQEEDDEMELDDDWSNMEDAMASLLGGGGGARPPAPSAPSAPSAPAAALKPTLVNFPIYMNGVVEYIQLETEGGDMNSNLNRVRELYKMTPSEPLYLYRKQSVPGCADVEVMMNRPSQMEGANMLFVG